MAPVRGPNVALPQPQAHLVEFVSLLGLLLPTSLSSNSVFFSPPDLPVIILWALGGKCLVRCTVGAPCFPLLCPVSFLSIASPFYWQSRQCLLRHGWDSSSPLFSRVPCVAEFSCSSP